MKYLATLIFLTLLALIVVSACDSGQFHLVQPVPPLPTAGIGPRVAPAATVNYVPTVTPTPMKEGN